jgi:fatty acid desaturase
MTFSEMDGAIRNLNYRSGASSPHFRFEVRFLQRFGTKTERISSEFPYNRILMRVLGPITDPVYVSRRLSSLDSFFVQFIRDERDLPFIYLGLKIMSVMIPLDILLFLPQVCGNWWSLVAVVHLAVFVLGFLGPFTLMLHLTSHRRFFKEEYAFMNSFIPWVLCPFMGQTPQSYYSHHVGMHHAENNLKGDGSSTMAYKRDEILHFLHYFFNFLLLGEFELTKYLLRKEKKIIRHNLLLGEIAALFYFSALSYINARATLHAFVLPYLIIRFGMMAGNWAQHAFIDKTSPENNYRNSITCVNATYNHLCFNDGYHIGHHLRPTMHWTEMPSEFLANQQKYIDNRAIVFEEIDFFIVWFILMVKRYDWLAYYFVNLGGVYKSDDEVIAMLKKRLQKSY